MVGLDEVTAATGDMTLETPQDQEAPSHQDEDPGTQDEPQGIKDPHVDLAEYTNNTHPVFNCSTSV